MKPFALTFPKDLAEARTACADGATYKAAGIDLLDRMKERKETLPHLVDLLRLQEQLGSVRATATGVTIGTLVTLHGVAEHPLLESQAWLALREACDVAATPQIRRRATLGGNLLQKSRCWYLRGAGFGCVHGGDGPTCMARDGENRYHAVLSAFDCVRVHPSNAATALCTLDAQAEIQSADGVRTIPIRSLWPEFGLASFAEHTLAEGEVLIGIVLPKPAAGTRSAYREAREKASFDWPTTAAAVRVTLDGERITQAAICLGAVSPVPYLATAASDALAGKTISEANFTAAADLAFADAQALSQNAYKITQGKAILIDALRAACTRS